MIDPITALAGIQSAVALIKKVSKTVDDVSSLGPVLGKYFDAKNKATKAAHQAKSNGNKSNMAVAIEIEMALEQTKQFEKELKMIDLNPKKHHTAFSRIVLKEKLVHWKGKIKKGTDFNKMSKKFN
jgi:hypothetical protein